MSEQPPAQGERPEGADERPEGADTNTHLLRSGLTALCLGLYFASLAALTTDRVLPVHVRDLVEAGPVPARVSAAGAVLAAVSLFAFLYLRRADVERRWRRRLVVGVLMLLAGVCALTVLKGEVRGIEFSPTTFEHRAFRYFQIPVLRLRVTPLEAEVARTPLGDYLVERGHITPTSEPDWSLVRGFQWGSAGWRGPMADVCRGLDCWRGGDQRWVTWSRANPSLADFLWPKVVAAAQAYETEWVYLSLWEAEQARSVDELERALKRLEGG